MRKVNQNPVTIICFNEKLFVNNEEVEGKRVGNLPFYTWFISKPCVTKQEGLAHMFPNQLPIDGGYYTLYLESELGYDMWYLDTQLDIAIAKQKVLKCQQSLKQSSDS